MAERVSYIISIMMVMLTQKHHVHSSVNFIIFNIDGEPMADWTESQPDPNLNDYTIEWTDAPTPHIDAFRTEAIVFPRVYAGGSACAPSRYSLLTGRYAVRSKYAREKVLSHGSGRYGPNIECGHTKITGYDNTYNVAATMQSAGYYTATVGKWHLMAGDMGGDTCDTLIDTADEDIYVECIHKVATKTGFDFVDAFYTGNIQTWSPYVHNPEWIVSQAQKAMDAAVDADEPFFLYIAPTLMHDPSLIDDGDNVFTDHDYTESPKGTLTGDDIPNDTLMTQRGVLWQYIKDEGYGDDDDAARAIWMDDMFGAIIKYLKAAGIFHETFIMFSNDHGVYGKYTLYEQGIRTMQFIRYPKLFPVTDGPYIVSKHLITAQYDIPAVIYDIAGIDIDDDYVMDGESWVTDVQNLLDGDDEDDISCCTERYIDIRFEHAIVHKHYKYIWKAKYIPDVADMRRLKYWAPDSLDMELMYNLHTDPSEQSNLLEDVASMTKAEKKKLKKFRTKMDDYVTDIACPLTNTANCLTPSSEWDVIDFDCVNEAQFTKQWDVIDDDLDAKLAEAEQEITCDYSEYAYQLRERENVLLLDMIVCCGNGRSFRGKYDEMYTVKSALNVVQNDALNVVHNEALNVMQKDRKSFVEANGFILWIMLIGLCVVFFICAIKRFLCGQTKGEYVALLQTNDMSQSNTYGFFL